VTDRIDLIGLEVMARHGVFASEKVQPQKFVLDVSVFADLSAAGESDDLADTIDYGSLAGQIHEVVSTESHSLIETVAARVAEVALADGRIEKVLVTVHKPEAPVGLPFVDVAVTIERSR
jgi:dihydroneopterin aldolase